MLPPDPFRPILPRSLIPARDTGRLRPRFTVPGWPWNRAEDAMSTKKTVWVQLLCRGAGCTTVFHICRSCYRGQAYCGDTCRKPAKVQQHRKANKKYQDSWAGRLDHRDRQEAYRKRCYLRFVTDVASPRPDRSGSIAKPEPEAKTKPREVREIRVWDPRGPFPRRRALIRIVCRLCGRAGLTESPR